MCHHCHYHRHQVTTKPRITFSQEEMLIKDPNYGKLLFYRRCIRSVQVEIVQIDPKSTLKHHVSKVVVILAYPK